MFISGDARLAPSKDAPSKSNRRAIQIDGVSISVQDVLEVAWAPNVQVTIGPSVKPRLEVIWSYVDGKVEEAVKIASEKEGASQGGPAQPMSHEPLDIKRRAIYGVTTGFGALKGAILKSKDAARRLQKNIILSHSSGTGPAFSDEVVRAVMFMRAHTLARGHCGVRYELLQHLVAVLNCGVSPVIPEQGSVGASGDLAPLAHLALGLIGEGRVRFRGELYKNLGEVKEKFPTDEAFAKLDANFPLSYKEGLALVNGITVTTALAILNFDRACKLLLWADVIGSMTAEAILGAPRAFDEIVFKLIYGHKGAAISAQNIRAMVQNSELINQSHEVHDPYSVRCMPQVHGAVRDVLKFVNAAVDNHLQTVDDDPVFFTGQQLAELPPVDGWSERLHFEHGHFHGAPVGYAMDFLGIALADLGSISERRVAMLVDKNHNRGGGKVPGFLTYDPENTTSGVMIAQYMAAALVSENKVLAHPASVDSVPTSANHEDHVSMSTIAARKASSILNNVETILATELLCSSLALAFRVGDLRAGTSAKGEKPQLGAGTSTVYLELKALLNGFQAFDQKDCILHEQIEAVRTLLHSAPRASVALAN